MLSLVPIAATGKTRFLPQSEEKFDRWERPHRDPITAALSLKKRQIRSTVAEKGLGARWKGQLGDAMSTRVC